MRALVCREYGPAEKLVIEERPEPVPGAGEIRVDVHAAGINFPDNLMIQGQYQVKLEPPFIPGGEAAGIVSALGEGVTRFQCGDQVIVLPPSGAFAEQCLAPAELAVPMASRMNFAQAAGFSVTYGTSYHALKQSAALARGETVVVLGAAGGVGIAAVELAHALGARVIAAAGNEEKLAFAREAGADECIHYGEDDLNLRVKELTQGKGAAVVFDPVGGALAKLALRATAWHGRYLVIGFASGEIPSFPANLALLKEAAIIGVWWGTWASRSPHESQRNMAELLSMVEDGVITPRVTRTFCLENFSDAFATITQRRALGKVVLTLRDD